MVGVVVGNSAAKEEAVLKVLWEGVSEGVMAASIEGELMAMAGVDEVKAAEEGESESEARRASLLGPGRATDVATRDAIDPVDDGRTEDARWDSRAVVSVLKRSQGETIRSETRARCTSEREGQRTMTR